MLNNRKPHALKTTKITNTASLEINGSTVASAKATFLVAESADLSVTQINPMHLAYVGQNLIHIIKVSNNGSSKATGVILTDILPPNCICSYINSTQGTYKFSKKKVIFFLGELDCNTNAIAIINIIPRCPCILTNHCFVLGSEHDNNLNNNFYRTNTKVCYISRKLSYCLCPSLHCLK